MIKDILDRLGDQANPSVEIKQDCDLDSVLAGYEAILENLLSAENYESNKKVGEIAQHLLESHNSTALIIYMFALDLYYRREYHCAYKAIELALLLAPEVRQLHLLKARILDAFGNTKESESISDSSQEALFMSQAESEMPGIDYYGWLRRLHELLKPETYVEIGLGDGRSLSLTGPKTVAIGVDPYKGRWELLNYSSPYGSTTLFPLASDDFFSQKDLRNIFGKDTIDLAFIDGLHHFDQVLKDFINLERYAGKNSMILMHDCLPVSPIIASRERNTAFWTGDVWRIIPCLKTFRPDLRVITIPTKPSGLTVVTCLDSESKILSENYEAIIKYYAGLNLPISMSERFALLNVKQYDWDTFADTIIAPEIVQHNTIVDVIANGSQTSQANVVSIDGTPDRNRNINRCDNDGMSMPKVSIINVICGNNIDFMGKCLNSLINNTNYPNVEFIVVTNSGNEMNGYISNIAKDNPAIKCVYRDSRHSNSSNRNLGALQASPDSKYYLFADSDVMYSNDQWLMNLVDILEENNDIGMIGGGECNTLGHYCYIDEPSGVLKHHINCFGEDLVQNYHIEMMIIPGYNMLIRKEIFTAIGGWDEGFIPVYGEDVDICLRCILAGYSVFGIYNKGVHHLYRDTKENNSSELIPTIDIQYCLCVASLRRLALKYEGLLPTKRPESFQEAFDAIKKMRDCGHEYFGRIKTLPPTINNGKINHLYFPLTNTPEMSKVYNDITLDC